MNEKECSKCRGDLLLVRNLHNRMEDIWICADCEHKETEPLLVAARIIASLAHAVWDSGEAI
jgi:hypothetical protein